MYTNKSIRKGKCTGERWEVGESTGASRQQGDPWGIMGQTHTWPMKTALEDPPLRVVPAIGIHPSSSVVKKKDDIISNCREGVWLFSHSLPGVVSGPREEGWPEERWWGEDGTCFPYRCFISSMADKKNRKREDISEYKHGIETGNRPSWGCTTDPPKDH